MRQHVERYQRCVKDKSWAMAMASSFALLLAALIINYFSGIYATAEVSNPVTDLILNNIPVFEVEKAFLYGGVALVVLIFVLGFRHPHRAPFMVKAISLFYIVRSVAVTLTHIAPFPSHIVVDPVGFMRFFNFDGQLFFSGHTGLPLLIALVFWESKRLRYSFLALSGILAIVTLMGHLHYSIDVFAAFFITHGVFRLAQIFFKKDSARDESLMCITE